MNELIAEFQSESKTIIGQLIELLESIESDPKQYLRLEECGLLVDNIMGSSKSLAMMSPEYKNVLESIGSYAELCKAVSYKGSQVGNNKELTVIVVALLLDAVEKLEEMVKVIEKGQAFNIRDFLSGPFLDRLKWVCSKFSAELSGTVNVNKKQTSGLDDIQKLLKSFGVEI